MHEHRAVNSREHQGITPVAHSRNVITSKLPASAVSISAKPRSVGTANRNAGLGMGLLKVGLGLARVVAPDGVAKLLGGSINGTARATIRALGVREVVVGIGILTQSRPTIALSAHLAGDFMDLAIVTHQMLTHRRRSGRLMLATATTLLATVVDAKAVFDAAKSTRRGAPGLAPACGDDIQRLPATTTGQGQAVAARVNPEPRRPSAPENMQRSLASIAPPKPEATPLEDKGQTTSAGDAPNDAIPFTHFTGQGFGTTRDDDAN